MTRFPVRYLYWVKEAVTDKFGTPLFVNEPIWPDLKRVIPHTLALVLAAELISILIGVSIGFLLGDQALLVLRLRRDHVQLPRLRDAGVLARAHGADRGDEPLLILARPHLLHVRAASPDPGTGIHWLIDRAQHLAIPVLVLCVLNMAVYSRFMRASLLEVVNTDYVRTARAKGLTEQRVTMRHAVRNALIPVVTLAALNFGALIGGAIITEQIFQLDGMGNYFIQNLFSQDVYPIMAWLMITAIAIIIFNLIADILYGVLDPRVRYD